jgi:hypothetical protein
LATSAFTKQEVLLQDDTEVVLRPLPIGRLRRFMDAWAKIGEVEEGGDNLTVFINCSGVALEDNFKGKFETLKASVADQKKGEFLSPEYKEYLENVLDLETIFVILEVCGGIKLNDPKLLEEVERQTQ